MSRSQPVRLRQALAARGIAPASRVPEASGGRVEEATIQPATLLEGRELVHHPVGPADPCAEPMAFLDGTQRSEVLGYAGAAPLVWARVAAAVRERRERRLTTVAEVRRTIVVGRRAALDAAAGLLDEIETVAIEDDGPVHPVRDLLAASRKVDQARGNLELEVADRYRRDASAWLVVDGSLTQSPRWAADERMIGISKSHSTLPFDGAELERYLRLPALHRSSLFAPPVRSFAPVAAWALRLWPWEGKDVFHGLIRVEVAPAVATPAHAERISRWLLAERAPLSTPDPRWDRLLYGIHAVEEYLKAT